MSRKFQKKAKVKARKVDVEDRAVVVLPLSMDLEKISTMASVYSFIAKHRIPYLFMNRVMKTLRGLTGKESERVSALIAIHSEHCRVEDGILAAYGDGVNYDVFLRLQSEGGAFIYGSDQDYSDEHVLIQSLKERWKIQLEDGHGLYLLAFDSLPQMDKVLGITERVELQKELIREIGVFDSLLAEVPQDLNSDTEYRTTGQVAINICRAIDDLKKSKKVFEPQVA